MSNDPLSDALAFTRSLENDVARRAESAEQMQQALSALAIVGSNADGSVKVKIDSTGGLKDLKLTDAAMQLSAEQLREEILRGVQKAQQHLSQQVGKIASKAFGADTETTHFITESYVDQFGVPDPDDDDSSKGRR